MKKGWAITWISNSVTGKDRHLLWADGRPVFFETKEKAKTFIKQRYGYIKDRKDLRQEPHMWRMPRPVKAILSLKEIK